MNGGNIEPSQSPHPGPRYSPWGDKIGPSDKEILSSEEFWKARRESARQSRKATRESRGAVRESKIGLSDESDDEFFSDYISRKARRESARESRKAARESEAYSEHARLDPLYPWAVFVRIMAFMTLVVSAIYGIILVAHTAPKVCHISDYSYSSCGKSHPFVWYGIGVLLGGTLQTLVLAAVSKVCFAMAYLRPITQTVTNRPGI